MGRQLLGFVAATAMAVLMAGPVAAAAVDDANAGEAALSRNDYNTAIEMFTRAIASGELAPADAESAYIERAKAYIGLGNGAAAQSDLNQAQQLNPNDPDVASLTASVQSSGGGLRSGPSAPSAASQPPQAPGPSLEDIPAPFRDFFRRFGQGGQGGGQDGCIAPQPPRNVPGGTSPTPEEMFAFQQATLEYRWCRAQMQPQVQPAD